MKKKELIDKVAERTNVSKNDCKAIVDMVFEEITNALAAGDSFTMSGFGTFLVRERAERMGVNPRNREEKKLIPAMKAPSFKASKVLKEKVR